MARAYGSSAHLLMKRETAYGQAATGNYLRMPFNRCNLGSEQGLIDDPVLGQGRDPLAPLQDVITDEGDIVVPVDPRYLGLWLTGLFGDPDTTDNLDGSWDHEFASGGDTAELHGRGRHAEGAGVLRATPASSSTRSRWSSPAQVLLPPRSAPSPRGRPGSAPPRAARRPASTSAASASSRARSSAPAARSGTSPAARSPTPTTSRRSRRSETTV